MVSGNVFFISLKSCFSSLSNRVVQKLVFPNNSNKILCASILRNSKTKETFTNNKMAKIEILTERTVDLH